jgi:6-phosphogluconolactonase
MRSLTRKLPQTIVAALAALTAWSGGAAVPALAVAHARPAGYVYVDDNTARPNTVAVFARQADGRLTPLPGSPFNAGGHGTGAGLPSQDAIQVSSDGRYVLAVDAGSNQISVLRIEPDGALRLVSVTSSGGIKPVSIAEKDGLAYVANAGVGGSNYTGFTLNRGGQLRPLMRSTIDLPDDAEPVDVLINATGTNLVGTRVGSSLIDSFRVRWDGRLTAAPGSPFAAQGPGPFGSAFRPTQPSQLFVSNAHGGADSGSVSAFKVAEDGSLRSIGRSPFADGQTAPCWVTITPDGRLLFTVNTGSSSVSGYSIAPDGALTLLGSTQVGTGSGVVPIDARVSADGRNLYVDEGGAKAVAEFVVGVGRLTAEGSAPLPVGATPAGIAIK